MSLRRPTHACVDTPLPPPRARTVHPQSCAADAAGAGVSQAPDGNAFFVLDLACEAGGAGCSC